MKAVVLSADQVRAEVSMKDAIDAVRAGFIGLARGEFEMPTRTALRDGAFLVMSAHHEPTATAMIKTLSLNFTDREPAIIGTVTWSDLWRDDHLIADAAAVTALRTGAASGVATELLARPDASSLVVIGAGGQSADQVRAVNEVRPLEVVTIIDAVPAKADGLAAMLADELSAISISAGSDGGAALAAADIVCCATTATAPLFDLESLNDDVHINAIGAFRPTMRELSDEVLAAATVYVDQTEAILEESGEIIHALASAAITEADLHEIGPALESDAQRSGRTVFKTVGVAMQDWAIAHALAQRFTEE